MIDFKKEEETYQQIQLIKSVLADFRAYNVIRQAQIDIMYHFNVFFTPIQEVSLSKEDKITVKINSIGIGYTESYDEIAHIVTDLHYDNIIRAQFKKEYIFKDVTFIIDDYLVANIPEEELLLLELLGKVEVTITKAQPSTVTKSIFCPTQVLTPPSNDILF
jgi:hypothetical protein